MTPDDDSVRLAFKIAGILAREWGYSRPGEYVGAAWEGIAKARARGLTGRSLYVAGKRAVIDRVRAEQGRPGRPGHAARKASVRLTGCVPAREPVPDVDPVLALWCQTRDRRAGMTARARVLLALWLVEGLTFEEVASVVGEGAASVSGSVGRALAAFPGGREAVAGLARARGNQARCRRCGA